MEYADRLRAELKTRCVWLRTKAAYLPLPESGAVENPYDTAVWWCLRTAAAFGPDDHAAGADTCGGPGRPCYEPPVRL
jgi:hypothetical protein